MITVMIIDNREVMEKDQSCQNIYSHALAVSLCDAAYAERDPLFLGHEMHNIQWKIYGNVCS